MTQVELIEWALSGVKIKRIAMIDGYERLKGKHPDAANAIMKVYNELLEKEKELDKMKEALKNEQHADL